MHRNGNESHFEQQASKLEEALKKENIVKAGAILLNEFDQDPQAALALIRRQHKPVNPDGARIDIESNGEVMVSKNSSSVYGGRLPVQGECPPQVLRFDKSFIDVNANNNPILSQRGNESVWSQFERDDMLVRRVPPDESAAWQAQVPRPRLD